MSDYVRLCKALEELSDYQYRLVVFHVFLMAASVLAIGLVWGAGVKSGALVSGGALAAISSLRAVVLSARICELAGLDVITKADLGEVRDELRAYQWRVGVVIFFVLAAQVPWEGVLSWLAL